MLCSKVAASSLHHLCLAVNLESLTCVCEAGRKILFLDDDRYLVKFRPLNSVSSLVVNRLSSVMAIMDFSLFSRELGVRLTSPWTWEATWCCQPHMVWFPIRLLVHSPTVAVIICWLFHWLQSYRINWVLIWSSALFEASLKQPINPRVILRY